MPSRRFLPMILLLGILLIPMICRAEKPPPPPMPPESLDMNLTTFSELAAAMSTVEYIPGKPGLLVYGTGRGFVYLYKVYGSRMKPVAETNLWKGIKSVTLVDMDQDGAPEVVVLTKEAMLYVLDREDLTIIWSTEESYFEGISCFTVADMEDDGQNEIIILADNHLFVFDIGSGYERWKSLVERKATHIVAGDVDGDGMKELVLSDGTVLGPRLYEEEWIWDQSFGHRMILLDMDNDGILEVVSLDGGGNLQIVDVDERARQWK
ncbi:MAG: hypothetical protein KAW17_11225 [Candidatus Eisenbacteria sp.]|nr:hypothetical protein [Candidatus Eisenbacteria bacterium]